MVKIYKIHKYAGVSAGILLLMLAITGFLLDHDNWNFLYTTTFKTDSKSLLQKDKRLFESYLVDKANEEHIIVATKRGIYESDNKGLEFHRSLKIQTMDIERSHDTLYAATSDGIYKSTLIGWKNIFLEGKYINAFSIHENTIIAIEDKKYLYVIDISTKSILKKTKVFISQDALQDDIKLSRFVRDLHYGRGLFDDGFSLLLNDYATLFLFFLALSGYYIFYLIKKKKSAHISRKLIKIHANIFAIFASFFLIILAITGIFLDHSNGLAKFMRSINIPHSILPPIYSSLKEDIWSVDYDGKDYRIGNRFGVYKSDDLKTWEQESKGFAYKMMREEDKLYVSGMGAPNRLLEDDFYTVLAHTPHMFKSILSLENATHYISYNTKNVLLPNYKDITLFSIILALHDGSFFSSWWVWINDGAAIALILLSLTGTYRWYKKMYHKKASF